MRLYDLSTIGQRSFAIITTRCPAPRTYTQGCQPTYISLKFRLHMAAFKSSSTCPATERPTPRSRPRRPRPRSAGESTDSASRRAPRITTAPTLSIPFSFFSTSPMVFLACWMPNSSSCLGSLCWRPVHSINGSAMYTWSTDNKVCLLLRSLNTPMQSSQLLRKTPSMPVTPMAATQFCVSRKGTVSGRSSNMPLPKRQSKSTCTMRPDSVSSKMFSPCRSPSPMM
mmetsp:Transcript_170480/g.546754  ORF Transcript_170480/g.546754 Transcript_170480/m.546754 type:complete len:226 (+) Transcript_170480:1-678(+)